MRFEPKYLIIVMGTVMAASGALSATVTVPALIGVFGLLTKAASNAFSHIYHV